MHTPRSLNLPYDDWRPGQRLAIRTILHGKSHTAISAPTGTGKSLIAEAPTQLQPGRRQVTLTGTKALQDQYSDTFPFLTDFRGSNNYPCLAVQAGGELRAWGLRAHYTMTCDEGPCHAGESCSLKKAGCLYYDAWRAFSDSQAGLTNYTAWLSNRTREGMAAPDRLVCDEAHDLPDQLMKAAGVDIPAALVPSRLYDTAEGWRGWAEGQLKRIGKEVTHPSGRRQKESLQRGLKRLVEGLDETWAWDVQFRGSLRLEPTVPRLLLPLLYDAQQTRQVVYLSATLTPSLFDLLGIPQDDVTFHTMESHFAISRRPIYFVTGAWANFQRQQDPEQQQKLIDAIDGILETRPDRKGLVHSVSYDRAKIIWEGSHYRDRMFLHRRGDKAADVYEAFCASPAGTVLVSPVMMTGHDFAYDKARFQVIPKMPFADTRSAIMQARIQHTEGYRDHCVMQQFIQACGRIVRGQDDWGETFVTDELGARWYQQHNRLAPDWFHDAVQQTRRVIPPMFQEGE